MTSNWEKQKKCKTKKINKEIKLLKLEFSKKQSL